MAGRNPQPWYWAARRSWHVVLNGRRVTLGPDKAKAFRRFHRLMAVAEGGDAPAGDTVSRTPDIAVKFGDLAAEYLDDHRSRVSPRTHYVARGYLKPILAALGNTHVGTLKKAQVEAAIRSHRGWCSTTQAQVRDRVMAVLNWAVGEGKIATNPLRGMRRAKCRTRGVEALVSPDDHARLLATAPPYLRDVLVALQQTGARPCEVLRVTAAGFDPTAGVWVFEQHKTAHRTGKPRVVHLTAEVIDLCKRLAARHPTGPLSRRASGKPFPEGYYLARLVRSLCRKASIRGVRPYSYRHALATDALSRGVPDAHVAELLGHCGTAVLHRVYAHLGAKSRVLRDALASVR